MCTRSGGRRRQAFTAVHSPSAWRFLTQAICQFHRAPFHARAHLGARRKTRALLERFHGAESKPSGFSRRATADRLSTPDRKSTRLNSSHGYISYAVFCLKKK